jgi:hypothetical protein
MAMTPRTEASRQRRVSQIKTQLFLQDYMAEAGREVGEAKIVIARENGKSDANYCAKRMGFPEDEQ